MTLVQRYLCCKMTYSMKTALSAICDVHMGYTVRSGLKAAPEGGIRAIQLRDLQGEDDLDPASARLYSLDPSLKRYSAVIGWSALKACNSSAAAAGSGGAPSGRRLD